MMLRRMTALIVIESLLLSFAPLPLAAEPELPLAAAAAEWMRSMIARPDAGGVLELAGLRLEVPAGAVRKPTTITVTRLPATERLGDGMANATAGTAAWRFEPHGVRFARAVRVTMPFERGVLASEPALSNLFTYFYDAGARRWERLERVAIDREAATITSLTGHFTDMIAATLRLPEGPSPVVFDANEIKRLDAARPDAGVPAPEGFAPGPYGAAAFRIPLRLPPGRGAASPALALTYSSDAGATWLGRGFDVEVPRVSIDTRFGLPRYDGGDTCLLDGEELVFAGSEGDARLYRARTERRFERIRWHASGGDSWWQVTDKAGVTREYGRGEAWIGPERGDRSRTFTWFLSKVRDPFGNTASWDYQYDEANRCTYLCAIRYAGHEDGAAVEEGAYSVEFVLEAVERPDRRIDARGGFASKLARRLERINLLYRGALVRSWVFRYRASETGHSLLASFTEQDAAGSDFYTYGFDYFALPERRDANGALLGYDAFGEREIQWAAEQGDRFTSLHEGVTTGGGASLYVGVRFFLPVPFFRKKTIAHFGVRAGAGVSQAMTRATLLDANGDGLLDAVWREGSSLAAFLNTGSGFDLSQPFRLSGLNDGMDLEEQSSFSLGASAGLLGVSGGVTRHRSWSEERTAFADVNGDGFVDFVKKDEGTWAGHDGSSRLVATPWSFGTAEPAGGADPEADDYSRSFYLQQPLRRLKIYRSGTVEVAQRVALAGAGSEDGARARTHFAGGTDTLAVSAGAPVAQGSRLYNVESGDSVYFRLETGDAEVGDDVDWNIDVRYRSLRYFEPLAQAAFFSPPRFSPENLPFYDGRLAPIYTSYGSDYMLADGWQEWDPAALAGVYDALIEHGLFVPRRVAEPLFRRLLASCSGESIFLPDPADPERAITVRGDKLVMHAYRYIPELAVFERASGSADAVLMRHLDALTLAERRGLALVRRPDGALVAPEGVNATARLRVAAAALEMPARLPRDGIPLDQTYDEEGRLVEASRLRSESGSWRVWRTDAGGESEIAATVTGTVPGAMTVKFVDRGVERACTLSGWTSLLVELAGAVYEGALSAAVMDGETISAYGIETLELAVYDALLVGASAADRDLLAACYVLEGDRRLLADPLSDGDWERLLTLIDGRSERDASLFDVLPGDAAGALRIVALDPDERSALAAVSPAAAAMLDAFGSPRRDLGAEERAVLYDALFRYRRDAEKFPFYTYDGPDGVWRLRG